jgi:hypothetical protein
MCCATHSHNPSIPNFFPHLFELKRLQQLYSAAGERIVGGEDEVYSKYSSFFVQKFLKHMTMFLLFKLPTVITYPFINLKDKYNVLSAP